MSLQPDNSPSDNSPFHHSHPSESLIVTNASSVFKNLIEGTITSVLFSKLGCPDIRLLEDLLSISLRTLKSEDIFPRHPATNEPVISISEALSIGRERTWFVHNPVLRPMFIAATGECILAMIGLFRPSIMKRVAESPPVASELSGIGKRCLLDAATRGAADHPDTAPRWNRIGSNFEFSVYALGEVKKELELLKNGI